MPGRRTAVKRLLLGRPRATRVLAPVLLPKRLAVPVLGSDPLSSMAYAPGQLLLVLALAGATQWLWPLTLGIAVLFVVVVAAYRQLVLAYPHGGGAYAVAREHLGEVPGLLAASSRFVELALAVAVSITAATAALVAVAPNLAQHRTAITLGLLAVITVGKLRGLKESGTASAVPAVLFLATVLMLGVMGVVRCALGVGSCVAPAGPAAAVAGPEAVSVTVVLQALAIGAVALAGIETVADGVGGVRYPQSRNTARTLTIVAGITVTVLLVLTALATATGVDPTADPDRTVLALIALTLVGDGFVFFVVQAATAGVLLLAASMAYADLPRLTAVLAGDRFLPRHLVMRGDRLVFSNALLLVAAAAAALVAVSGAGLRPLLGLYVVAVFPSFVLAQAGLARRHLARRDGGWRAGFALTAGGALVTGLVLVVATVDAFGTGSWAVWLAMAALVGWMRRIRRHYRWVNRELGLGTAEAIAPRDNHVVLILDRVDEASARAVSYAHTIAPASLQAVAVPGPDTDLEARWHQLAPDVPLELLAADGTEPGAAVRAALRARAAERGAGGVTTALMAETLSPSWYAQLTRHRLGLRLTAGTLARDGVVTTTLTSPEGGPGPYTIEDPAEHHVVVLVSGVHRATMEAVAYADSLRASTMRALTVNVDPQATRRTLSAWERSGLTTPLELVDSPLREITTTLRHYLREFAPDGRSTVVSCVIPELVLPRRLQQPLHNQLALLVKSTLLFERGVVTISVPTHVGLRSAVADHPAGGAPDRG